MLNLPEMLRKNLIHLTIKLKNPYSQVKAKKNRADEISRSKNNERICNTET